MAEGGISSHRGFLVIQARFDSCGAIERHVLSANFACSLDAIVAIVFDVYDFLTI